MSVLKYKDASGNWVEMDSVLTQGQLKVDYILPSEDGRSYDLTKYSNCNEYLMFYEYEDRIAVFSPNFNTDGTQWNIEERALNGFLTRTTQDTGNFIKAICSPVQGASALEGANKNLTKFENNIFSVVPYDAYLGEAFVIYAE